MLFRPTAEYESINSDLEVASVVSEVSHPLCQEYEDLPYLPQNRLPLFPQLLRRASYHFSSVLMTSCSKTGKSEKKNF